MTRTGNAAIIEQFIADGFTYMFGNPGTVEQGFLDELASHPELQYILTLQETVAAGIADGYARATGRASLLQLHSGVGLGNAIGMLYQAKRGHTPMLVVAGEAGVRYDAMDAQMAADLVAMARPVTKYATRVLDPSSVLRVLRRAHKIAMTPPRGPVFVALPLDVLDAVNDEPVLPTSLLHTAAAPAPQLLEEAAGLLAGASRPIILCGDGVSASGANEELTRVAELLGADVYGVEYSEVNFSATHPLFRGQLGHMFGEVSTSAVADADAVLVVGTFLFPEVFPSLVSPFRDGTPVVHVDLDGYEIAKNHPVTLGLVADPRATLAGLFKAIERTRTPQQAATAGARLRHRVTRRPVPPPMDESTLTAFVGALAQHLEITQTVIFDEALTASDTISRLLPATQAGHWFQTRGGSLGVGIPGAIGAKLAQPGKTVVGFTGDGGSMYTIQALAAAAKYRVGAKFVICNNHRYRLLDLNIEQYWRERGITGHQLPDPFDLSDPPLRFVDIARGFGVAALRVEKPEEVEDAVRQMLADDEPFLIDLATD